LIDSWETARACAMGGAEVVGGWHGSRYKNKNCMNREEQQSTRRSDRIVTETLKYGLLGILTSTLFVYATVYAIFYDIAIYERQHAKRTTVNLVK